MASEEYPYEKDPNGSAEVAGAPGGVTLLDCIRDGEIEAPGPLSYHDWLAWRKGPGRRPGLRRDGRGLSSAAEAVLWRTTLEALYGEQEVESLEEQEVEEEQPLPPAVAAESVSTLVPVGRSDTPPLQPGGLRPLGSALSSPTRSVNPSEMGEARQPTSDELLKRLMEMRFEPDTEDLASFLARLDRYVAKLAFQDVVLEDIDLMIVKLKAQVISEVYQEHLEGKLNYYSNGDMVRRLSDMFAAIARDDSLSAQEANAYAVAIRLLVGHYGGKDSARPGKAFSPQVDSEDPGVTPSASAKRAGPSAEESPLKAPRLKPGVRMAPECASEATDEDEDEKARLKAEVTRLKLELMERELGSETSSLPGGADPSGMSLAAAIQVQTETLAKVLAESNNRKRSTVTAVKTEVKWPRLSDEASDTKDVRDFYEQFEEVCGMANDCNGMGPQDMLLALRHLCMGSRLKTFTNIYKREARAGTVKTDPAAVYQMIKAKHLLFTETPDEKEIRVNKEFNGLMKGKMLGHQFEPVFDAAIANLEEVGLGKSKRELYLAYVEKIGPKLAQVVRRDRRLWEDETRLRGPETWEEAHHVVLEHEQTEHLDKVSSNATMATTTSGDAKELAKAKKDLDAANKKLAAQETKIAAYSGERWR